MTLKSLIANSLFAMVCLLPLLWIAFYQPCEELCAEWDYVEELLLEGSEDRRIVRWQRDPLVATNSTNPRNLQIVAGAISEMNKMLEGSGIQMSFESDAQEQADINLFFLGRQGYGSLTEELGIGDRTLGFAQTENDAQGNIVQANVVISDFLQDGETWGVVLHELGHALGITGHTDRFHSSLFFEDYRTGAFSDGYSARDRNLIKFLYRELPPGSDEAKVRSIFNASWSLDD